MTCDFVTEPGDALELAVGHGRLHLRTATFILEDLLAVEPMLHVIAVNENSGMIHPRSKFNRPVWFRRKDIIERRGLAFDTRFQAIVHHLILVSDSLLPL